MTNTDLIARAGGIWGVLVVIHGVIDFGPQSHYEAMNKHNNARIRARHCLLYTAPFIPLMWWMNTSWTAIVVLSNVLFWSHFVEDTYKPVFLWAKYLRRPPQMGWKVHKVGNDFMLIGPPGPVGKIQASKLSNIDAFGESWRDGVFFRLSTGQSTVKEAQLELDTRGFLEFVNETLGKLLMISIDQIIHIVFLLVVSLYLAGR